MNVYELPIPTVDDFKLFNEGRNYRSDYNKPSIHKSLTTEGRCTMLLINREMTEDGSIYFKCPDVCKHIIQECFAEVVDFVIRSGRYEPTDEGSELEIVCGPAVYDLYCFSLGFNPWKTEPYYTEQGGTGKHQLTWRQYKIIKSTQSGNRAVARNEAVFRAVALSMPDTEPELRYSQSVSFIAENHS